MSFIEMKNICKKYAGADKNSVTDFSLSVEEGEFIAFVGPSGCGKSTTLRMIAGFEEITSGDFYIDGKRMNAVLPRDRGISMVFQNYALYPHMTVEKNISYGLYQQRKSRRRWTGQSIFWDFRNTVIGNRRIFPAVSGREWHWDVQLSRIRSCFSWMSRFPIWTLS